MIFFLFYFFSLMTWLFLVSLQMSSILVLNCYVIIVILGAWTLMHRKQKLCFFGKRGGLLNSEVFTYNGNRLEVVNDFNYLGTVHCCLINNNQLSELQKHFKHVLSIKSRKYNFKPKLLYRLFDSFICVILNYSREIGRYSQQK